nr:branched-chain amino acid ABC transporter substrate-binding protein [Pseudomonas sp.]
MNRFRRTVLVSALAAGAMLATGPAAWAAKTYDAGASDTEITLGMPMPLSGPVSAYSV